jgi:hypothetical protein
VLDIGPSSNDGAEYHHAEGQQGHGRDRAAKPQDLTVGDDNDGQVLEDGVDWDGEILQGLGSGVDHANEQERDWEPFLGLVGLVVTIRDLAGSLAGFDRNNAEGGLFEVETVSKDEPDLVYTCIGLVCVLPNSGRDVIGQELQRTCTSKRKKFKLKPVPDRTNLLVKVIRMEAPQ